MCWGHRTGLQADKLRVSHAPYTLATPPIHVWLSRSSLYGSPCGEQGLLQGMHGKGWSSSQISALGSRLAKPSPERMTAQRHRIHLRGGVSPLGTSLLVPTFPDMPYVGRLDSAQQSDHHQYATLYQHASDKGVQTKALNSLLLACAVRSGSSCSYVTADGCLAGLDTLLKTA